MAEKSSQPNCEDKQKIKKPTQMHRTLKDNNLKVRALRRQEN